MADALDEFAVVAREYCAWCEAPSEREPEFVFSLLSRLVSGISRVETCAARDVEAARPTSDEYERVLAVLPVYPFNSYREFFRPNNLDSPEDCVGDICDDLADIWCDVKTGLSLFDSGARQAANFEWRLMFRSHWGRHATAAMRVIHCWIADNREPW